MPQHGGDEKVLNRKGTTTVSTRDNKVFVDVASPRVGNYEPGGNRFKGVINVAWREIEANNVGEERSQKDVESGNAAAEVHLGESSFEEIGTVIKFV